MPYTPATSVRAVLAAFASLGLDAEAIRRECGLDASALDALDGRLPSAAFGALWTAAIARAPRPTLATEVGLAVPFGSFGPLDYLAGSADTVGAGMLTLASHFRFVAAGVFLEVTPPTPGAPGAMRVVNAPRYEGELVSDEFTVAVIIGRFRALAARDFAPRAVALTRARPDDGGARHAALLGTSALAFDAPVAGFEFDAAGWEAPLRTADPHLRATIGALAARLALADDPGAGELEMAVRARLRALLPEGHADAPSIARLLGLSERTLHRRLAALGRPFQTVLDEFRAQESTRLLRAGTLTLAEVAARVGYADQSAWNRAFKRWTGRSPAAWRREHAADGAAR